MDQPVVETWVLVLAVVVVVCHHLHEFPHHLTDVVVGRVVHSQLVVQHVIVHVQYVVCPRLRLGVP